MVEYRPVAPGPNYLWVDGYWDWTGYDWYWVNGYYVPHRHGYAYVRPRYLYSNGRWVYHRSYWADGSGYRDYNYARPSQVWRGSPSATAAPPASPGWQPAFPPPGSPAGSRRGCSHLFSTR